MSPAPASTAASCGQESPAGGPSCHSTPVKQSLSSRWVVLLYVHCTIYFLRLNCFAFSFLRSKQRQSNNQRDSPRRSAVIDNYSSLNNSLHEEASASTTHSQPSSQSNGQTSHVAKDVTDNAIVDASPPLAMTQSTLDTLNSMTTENIKDERNDLDNSKGE